VPSGGRKRPERPRRLGPPTPFSRRRLPRVTSPAAFPDRPAPTRLTPVFPPHLPRTGVRRPAARPAHRPSHPPRPAKTNPPGHPLRLLQGGPRRPGGAGPGGGGGLPWIPAAARTRCQEAQGRDGAGGVAEPMDGPLAEGALPVGVHGTPSFLTPQGLGSSSTRRHWCSLGNTTCAHRKHHHLADTAARSVVSECHA
jgi:hypothetical protein